MPEPRVIDEPTKETATSHPLSQPIVQFLQELQATPREYWPNLLEIIRLFRQSVTGETTQSPQSVPTELSELSLEERIKRNQAVIDLINSWIEEGDEQEQTETAEYLERVLDEDRLSNRPLFPHE